MQYTPPDLTQSQQATNGLDPHPLTGPAWRRWHSEAMFIPLPTRPKASLRWATPLLLVALWLAFVWSLTRPD